MRWSTSKAKASRGTIARLMDIPTPMFERMVESIEMRPILSNSGSSFEELW
jgi:hypothetical protein